MHVLCVLDALQALHCLINTLRALVDWYTTSTLHAVANEVPEEPGDQLSLFLPYFLHPGS